MVLTSLSIRAGKLAYTHEKKLQFFDQNNEYFQKNHLKVKKVIFSIKNLNFSKKMWYYTSLSIRSGKLAYTHEKTLHFFDKNIVYSQTSHFKVE